jgi:MoaA/NifB/PqqE/SkfB family radical SAM enzyme
MKGDNMSVKPILFNTEMVRAILDGRKTVTRRLLKLPSNIKKEKNGTYTLHENGAIYENQSKEQIWSYIREPYQPGDILYVRETWGDYRECEEDGVGYYLYRADYPDGATTYQHPDGVICDLPKWHPSIHMPKESARIWLKVTDVRVERLQDITHAQVITEGTEKYCNSCKMKSLCCNNAPTKGCYGALWDSTVKKSDLDRYGWEANPWVWVIEFERCEKPEAL